MASLSANLLLRRLRQYVPTHVADQIAADIQDSLWFAQRDEQVGAQAVRDRSADYLQVAAQAARGSYHDDSEVLSDRLLDVATRLRGMVEQDRARAK